MMIAYLLRIYRRDNNLTGRELAKIIGIKHTTLWKFENGKDIEGCTFAKIINWVLTAKV